MVYECVCVWCAHVGLSNWVSGASAKSAVNAELGAGDAKGWGGVFEKETICSFVVCTITL